MWPFAVSISVAAFMTFVQSVFVGASLGGNVASLDSHRMTGVSLALVFVLGFSGRVELHVPLGVLIVALSALAALQSWRLIRRPAGALAS
jgi:hypothetical protein